MGLRKFVRSLFARPHRTKASAIAEFVKAVRPVDVGLPLVRIGGEGDGGYLVPDDLDGVRSCFSPGVSNVADFEAALAARGVRCFLADASVSGAPVQNALFDFEKKYLGSTNDDQTTTLASWIARKAPDDADMILQMDIEGAEYAVILESSPETLRRFRILVVEFHDLHRIGDKLGHQLIKLCFEKLLADFDVVHIHPNNCERAVRLHGFEVPPVMEITFIRKDRGGARAPIKALPHALDRKNIARKADIRLQPSWYEGKR